MVIKLVFLINVNTRTAPSIKWNTEYVKTILYNTDPTCTIYRPTKETAEKVTMSRN